ncbi:MAG: heme exporter protein CcmB [Deltaproteobacteria bacterium]|jgi:heme exporter protein B|nr:heme exporter protein CcmB [Deltaproteobacteria bacterium]
MLNATCAIFKKDLKLMLGKGAGSGLAQATLFGLLLIFIFSLTKSASEGISPEAAATVFWVATLFSLVLVFSGLYALEETKAQRRGLLLAPSPIQSIWLGKALAGLVIVLLTQLVFLPGVGIFLDQPAWEFEKLCMAPGVILLVDIGLVAPGSLLGALTQGQSAREPLLSIVIFPLLLPLLLAAIRLCAALFSADTPQTSESFFAWLKLVLAFDSLYAAAGLLLFAFVYKYPD